MLKKRKKILQSVPFECQFFSNQNLHFGTLLTSPVFQHIPRYMCSIISSYYLCPSVYSCSILVFVSVQQDFMGVSIF